MPEMFELWLNHSVCVFKPDMLGDFGVAPLVTTIDNDISIKELVTHMTALWCQGRYPQRCHQTWQAGTSSTKIRRFHSLGISSNYYRGMFQHAIVDDTGG